MNIVYVCTFVRTQKLPIYILYIYNYKQVYKRCYNVSMC